MMDAGAGSGRSGWRLHFALALLLLLSFAAPATAQTFRALPPVPADQTVMPDDGMVLPSFFFSRFEQAARRTCLAELPECRDLVRQQLSREKAISRVIPWVLLCIAIWIAVRYVNRRDKLRAKRKEEAARHHVRASVRQREARETARTQVRSETEEDDGFGMGLGDDDDVASPRGKR